MKNEKLADVHDQLFNQIDYIGLDSKQSIFFIRKMVEEWGIKAIIDVITEVLQTEKEEEIFIVSVLLRNACLGNGAIPEFHEIVNQFRHAVEKSDIFQLMNKNLYAKDRLIRESSYYTLGKLSFPQNAKYLKDAIIYYRKHFPDQLEGVKFEYNWLLHLN